MFWTINNRNWWLSIEIEGKSQIDMAHSVTIPGRTLAIVCIYNNLDPHQSGSLYEIEPNGAIINKYPNLCIIPMIHNVDVHRKEHLPLVVINFASDDISLSKGETMGFMQIQPLERSEIITEPLLNPHLLSMRITLMRYSKNKREKSKRKIWKRNSLPPC